MAPSSTRDALLEQGALLFARHGVHGVTTRQLHDQVGARNESALHYHFGSKQGLVEEIVRQHLAAVEARRAALVAAIAADDRTGDLRSLVGALVAPMADDLESPLGRAHLRIIAELNHPSLAYETPFPAGTAFGGIEAKAGEAVVKWLLAALPPLPVAVRAERMAALRGQLIGLLGLRAQLLDDNPTLCTAPRTALFVENLLDMTVAALAAEPSEPTLRAAR